MKPVLTIIAGSNGCGKSTLTSYAREGFQASPVLDPDAVAKSIRSTLSKGPHDIEAGKQVLRRADELLLARQSFTVETTLSGSTYLRMAGRAKAAGFLISLIFVGTSSVEINIGRIEARVLKGGHDIPEEDQRRRFPKTLANAAKLLPVTDLMVILDNSTIEGYRLVAFGAGASQDWIEPIPEWAQKLRTSLSDRAS